MPIPSAEDVKKKGLIWVMQVIGPDVDFRLFNCYGYLVLILTDRTGSQVFRWKKILVLNVVALEYLDIDTATSQDKLEIIGSVSGQWSMGDFTPDNLEKLFTLLAVDEAGYLDLLAGRHND